jgi:hypothetical protein
MREADALADALTALTLAQSLHSKGEPLPCLFYLSRRPDLRYPRPEGV